MAVHPILPISDPRLRVKAKKVHRFEPWVQALADDLFQTLHAVGGAGLAAPQIGQSVRMFVAEYEGESLALVNPEIVGATGTEFGTEGCLSLPGYVGVNIPRATEIMVRARDPRGRSLRVQLDGWFARIIQHETDHLDGILFLDRLQRPGDLKRVATEDDDLAV